MDPEVQWTEIALNELHGVADYIARDSGARAAELIREARDRLAVGIADPPARHVSFQLAGFLLQPVGLRLQFVQDSVPFVEIIGADSRHGFVDRLVHMPQDGVPGDHPQDDSPPVFLPESLFLLLRDYENDLLQRLILSSGGND